ncbi:MAG: maltose/maltodextrin ABC transporter substrate-binding protein MalE [Bacteriovoracaceae bacterium]
MKMMKLNLLFFLCLLCAQTNALEIWTSNENVKRAIEKLTPQFEKEFKHKVKVTILNKDLTSQFKTAAMSGKGPDILCWAHDVVGELASSGLIEPILLDESLKKELLPVAVKAYTYNGKVYGYPYDLEAIAFIYNKDLLPQVPETLEELVSLSQSLKTKGAKHFGFLYDYANFFFSFPILSAAGGYVFKNDGSGLNVSDVGLNNQGALTGAKFLARLSKTGVIPSSTDRSIAFDKMKNGKLAATIDGPWSIADLKRSKINYGVAPIPTLAGQKPKPFVGTHGFMIRRSSENKELAKELIENYFLSKEGIATMYKEDPRGPSRLDVLAELSKTDKDLKAFMESASHGIPMPNVPEMGAVWASAGGALKMIVTGQEKPKTALDQAVNQINAATSK